MVLQGLVLQGFFRILQGQSLHLHTISDAAATLRVWVRVLYDDGTTQLLTVPEVARSASRVAEDLVSADVIVKNGWVVNAQVEMVTTGIKRGQTYVRLGVEPFGCLLLADYCFSTTGPVALGTFVQPGPGGGSGNLEIVTLVDDLAPATVSTTLAVSNTVSKMLKFQHYYHASSDVASRTMSATLRAGLGAPPTGFDVINSTFWAATQVVLTADQLGAQWGDPTQTGSADQTTITIDNAASAPSPFPVLVEADDPIIFALGYVTPHANDRVSAYLLRESWVL